METSNVVDFSESLEKFIYQTNAIFMSQLLTENKTARAMWLDYLNDLISQTRQETIEEMIKLSDEIELREPDGGTKQWMAFKAFRNKMRDSLKERLK